MSKGVARVAIYLLLTIPLIVIGILISKQIQYAYELRKDFVEGNKLQFSASDTQQIMAASELSTRSFFLIFICFLMILCGLLITLRGTESAFSISKETKVRYSLRTAYPGVAMAIFGCLLLAYSIYKSAQLQQITTHQVLNMAALKQKAKIKQIDSVQSNDIVVFEPGIDTAGALIADDDVAPIDPPFVETVKTEKEVKHEPGKHRVQPVAVQEAPVKLPGFNEAAVSEDDVRWANQLASRSIAYGYSPSKSDNRRYNSIMRGIDKGGNNSRMNGELRWAFDLLKRTQSGYQPSSQELQRYESAISQQLRSTKVMSRRNEDVAHY